MKLCKLSLTGWVLLLCSGFARAEIAWDNQDPTSNVGSPLSQKQAPAVSNVRSVPTENRPDPNPSISAALEKLSQTPSGNVAAVYLKSHGTRITYGDTQGVRFGRPDIAKNEIVLSPALERTSDEFRAALLAYWGTQLKNSNQLYEPLISYLTDQKAQHSNLKLDDLNKSATDVIDTIQERYVADVQMLHVWSELKGTPDKDYLNFLTVRAQWRQLGGGKYRQALKQEDPGLQDLAEQGKDFRDFDKKLNQLEKGFIPQIKKVCKEGGFDKDECKEQIEDAKQMIQVLKNMVGGLLPIVQSYVSSIETQVRNLD